MQKKKDENCSSCTSFSEAERVIISVKNLRLILLKYFFVRSIRNTGDYSCERLVPGAILYMKNLGELQNLTRHVLPESHLIEQPFEKHATDFSVP